ncbi:MAG TPA: SpoIIE family protein phosphatase [Gemmatimonadales bacterium]|nr:SpoIIE family protein phosphatase [Gemmatimonadales bacterium]
MTGAVLGAQRWVEVGIAGRALQGQAESGDREVVRAFPGGVLLAALDGLGHGADAAEAARRACATLEHHAGESLITLVKRCHTDLVGTRGVAMSLASLNVIEGTLTWLGVGNVEGILWQKDAAGRLVRSGLVTRGGVLGAQLPPLRAEVLTVGPGDLLVFATDGIGREFAEQVALHRAPQELADHILAHHARANDDALVLVARFRLT